MPELPEVETIKRQLDEAIVGKKIKSVDISEPRIVKVALDVFKKAVAGAAIKAIGRRAKLLIIDLSNGYTLLIHLKMSGQLIYGRGTTRNNTRNYAENIRNKHTHKRAHIIYTFADGSKLFHNDLRKFGFVKLVKTEEVSGYLKKENYGPEPLERGFTLKVFSDLLSGRSRKKIKPTLMDQTFVAGIGNLYADEICFYAKIRPTRTIGSLTDNEIKKLFGGIKKILPEAIKYRGSSADQYLDAKGNPGAFVPRLKVYGREGEKCSRCDGVVKRIKIGGRSAHFCPKCQK